MNPSARTFLLLSTLALSACKEKEPPPDPRVQDRHELTLQPRGDWAPEKTARKMELKLQLIAEKTRIRSGDAFGYRLEIRNTGRAPVIFKEPSPSFMKSGTICAGPYRFYATPPGGKEFRLPCEEPGQTPAEDSALDLVLEPGEYLLTKPTKAFRRLRTTASFRKTGTYRIQAHYVDGSYHARSNPVALEVVP